MANYTPVRISRPETNRLADMHGVLQDLEWLINLCVQSHRIIGLTLESIDQLKQLAESLLALIRIESAAETARVLAITKQIPIAELEARLTGPEIRTGVRQLDNPRGG